MEITYTCTLGPSIFDKNMLIKLYENGMRILRINLSHLDYNFCDFVSILQDIEVELGYHIALMIDTRGREVRIISDQNIVVDDGDLIVLGKDFYLGCDYQILEENDILKIDDGKVVLQIKEKCDEKYVCKVIMGGVIKKAAGVICPKLTYNLPFLQSRDIQDILLAFKNHVEYIACSFVNNKEDILQILNLKEQYGKYPCKIFAKIETEEACKNFIDIASLCDGIMVARGDLATNLPIFYISYLTERIVTKTLELNKELIVATGFLKSMNKKAIPERSEVSDLYYMFTMGVRNIMFGGESAIGVNPIRVLEASNMIFDSFNGNLKLCKKNIL